MWEKNIITEKQKEFFIRFLIKHKINPAIFANSYGYCSVNDITKHRFSDLFQEARIWAGICKNTKDQTSEIPF